MNPEYERYKIALLKLSNIVLLMALLYFGFNFFIPLVFNVSGAMISGFMPFIIAIIIAILIDPIVDWLVIKKGIKRGYAVSFTISVMLLLIILLVVFIVSRLVLELAALYRDLPFYTKVLMEYGVDFFQGAREYISAHPIPTEAEDALRNNIQAIMGKTVEYVSLLSNLVLAVFLGLPALITVIIVGGLATYFISRDKVLITRFIYGLIPTKLIKPTSIIINEISNALTGFFRAQIILISITALLTTIGLSLLRIDYALTMGIIVGILDLLPVLGPGTVFIPWVVVTLAMGNINMGLLLLVLYGVTVGVRQLIEPKILSQNIGLHPLATLLSLYLGLKFIGIWGIIIGPFLVILFKAVMKSIKPGI